MVLSLRWEKKCERPEYIDWLKNFALPFHFQSPLTTTYSSYANYFPRWHSTAGVVVSKRRRRWTRYYYDLAKWKWFCLLGATWDFHAALLVTLPCTASCLFTVSVTQFRIYPINGRQCKLINSGDKRREEKWRGVAMTRLCFNKLLLINLMLLRLYK